MLWEHPSLQSADPSILCTRDPNLLQQMQYVLLKDHHQSMVWIDAVVPLSRLLSYHTSFWLSGESHLLQQSQWFRLFYAPNIWTRDTKRGSFLSFYLRFHRYHAQESPVYFSRCNTFDSRIAINRWSQEPKRRRCLAFYIESINSTNWRAKSIAAVTMGLIRVSQQIDGPERQCGESTFVFYLRVHWFHAQERRIRFDSRISIYLWSGETNRCCCLALLSYNPSIWLTEDSNLLQQSQ